MTSLAILPPASRPWVLCALASFLAALLGSWSSRGLIIVSLIVLGLGVAGRPVSGTIAGAIALIASLQVTTAMPAIPLGATEITGVLATDVIEGRYGPYALVDDGAGPILVDLPEGSDGSPGQWVRVEGRGVSGPGEAAGDRHRGVIAASSFEVVAEPRSPVLVAGNAIRRRVIDRLSPLEGGRALLAGFLVGDTSGIHEMDQYAMRRSGLSHYTAVSGSNVAIFLGLLFVVAGPAGIGPRRRAVVGLLGLPVFAATTGFEPSVVRASAMAALVLGGRLAGFALETWQVVAAAVVGLLILDPGLAADPGFQLSVAATVGVIVGSRYPVRRGRLARALAVGTGAQLAVAPLLILHFGQVPLLSPLANLLVAPVVATATVVGAIGAIGLDPAVEVASWLASTVLAAARVASVWPQVAWGGLALVMTALVIVVWRPAARPIVALLASGAIAWLVVGPAPHLPDPGVVVLDVGQGDAILLDGGDGSFALVDGGPDQVSLADSLARYRVRRLELVILTHPHADHSAGLAGLPGMIPVGALWAGFAAHLESDALADLTHRFGEAGVDLVEPVVGDVYRLGGLLLTVAGPEREYASVNDESIVLMVEGPERSMLLAGDIETHAQADLGDLEADVLKVPHHGGGTSDPAWLEGVDSDLAVISVGANDFGHPVAWVIDALTNSGAEVLRTDESGDVAVPLG
ncbi:MAG TPA: ComEC/Rec2 family competence protein [Acidimicrobiia bacterium]|nr:ComEC/Rec2 family competence protein [Acidimicrobiia bacterium]